MPFSKGFAQIENALSQIVQLPANENVLLVEKKTQRLRVYAFENGQWVIRLDVPCSTGEVSGIKAMAGDKKTPEGVYFLKDEYQDRYLSPVYGKKAFPLDYPNLMDRIKGRNGSAIWIHGTNKVLQPMDSNGCIALENENVVKLSDYIRLDSTPVIIAEVFEQNQTRQEINELKHKVNELLNPWTDALVTGTYHDVLSHYSSSYLPKIAYWQKWHDLKTRAVSQDVQFKIINENLGIYLQKNIFTVLFDHVLIVDNKPYHLGKRKLFLTNEKDGFKIIGDVYQHVPDSIDKNTEPVVGMMAKVLNPQMMEARVLAVVKNWLKAWAGKDMETYASYYAQNFYSDGMNKKKWVQRKKNISKKYSYIKIRGSNYKISNLTQTNCVVRFFQEYASSGFTAKGIKQLKLIKKGGSWKIFQESWKKN